MSAPPLASRLASRPIIHPTPARVYIHPSVHASAPRESACDHGAGPECAGEAMAAAIILAPFAVLAWKVLRR